MIISWIFIALLGVVAIAAFSQRFWQFGLLAGTAAIMAVSNLLLPFPAGVLVIFWIAWTICLLIAVFTSGYKPGVRAAVTMTVATLVLLVVGSLPVVSRPAVAEQELVVEHKDGKVSTLHFADNKAASSEGKSASASQPLVGTDTLNTTYATPTLKDGKGPVESWTDLYTRVEASDPATKAAYIVAFNARSQTLGVTWAQVPMLLAAEKAGVDTRVIQVVNSTVSDAEARNMVRADIGNKADILPVVYVTGAVMTTNGGLGSDVVATDWADARSTVHPFLTVPAGITTIEPASATANTRAASVSVGIDPNCKNINTGIVPQPQPKPVPVEKPKPQPTTPPVIQTTPPTTTPPTTPPTTTPPTTPPTCPPGQTGTPPDNCYDKKDPSALPTFPSGKPTDNVKPTQPVESTLTPEPTPANPSVTPSAPATQSAPSATAPAPDQPKPSVVPSGAPDDGTEIGDPGPIPSMVTSVPEVTQDQVVADKAAADAAAAQAQAELTAQKAAEQAQAEAVAAAQAEKAAAQKAASDAAAQIAAADKAALDAANEKAAQKAADDAQKAASAPAEPAETMVPTSDPTSSSMLLLPLMGIGFGLRRKAKTRTASRH